MSEQTLAIFIAGLAVVAFGGLASFMADRQKKQAKEARQAKQKAQHAPANHSAHDEQYGHAGI